MKLSETLGQIYFLGMHPREQEAVAKALREASTQPYASSWRIFSRLARPGIIALRTVSRSSGLDIFLLEQDELQGVEDIAEMLIYGMVDPEGVAWDDIRPEGCLFITFVRLDWDALQRSELWKAYGIAPPPKSQIFKMFCAALRRAVRNGILKNGLPQFHIGGGVGDCDALIIGSARTTAELNYFLLTLSQLGSDNLAAEFGAHCEKSTTTALPIVAESVTELGVAWPEFEQALTAADVALDAGGKGLHPLEKEIGVRLNQMLQGHLRGAIFLKRSCSTPPNARSRLTALLPPEWVKQEVLGEADALLRYRESAGNPSRPPELCDLLGMVARLDQQAKRDASFPKRHSVVVSFDDPKDPDLDYPLPERGMVLGTLCTGHEQPELAAFPTRTAREQDGIAQEALARCVRYLRSIHNSRLREELRIIERMVERCAVLQRQGDLPSETRRVTQLGLRRIARTLDHIERLEASGPEEWVVAVRHSLVNSGVHLERTISHLSRGNVPMLLATPTQARATDHFSSETMLATALACPASAVAGRIAAFLDKIKPPRGKTPVQWEALLETLRDMVEPIIYTSHGLDFMLARPLGIIHVPRWIMWYPTSSSLVLHEVGHALFSDGQLDSLLFASAKAAYQHATLQKWCKGLIENGDIVGEGTSVLTGISGQWRTDQHEIAAELFNRLFSYPAGAAREYLYDQLEYLHAIINRKGWVERIGFITRAFSVHVAHALLTRGEEARWLWTASAAEVSIAVGEAVMEFHELLRDWLRSPPPPFDRMEFAGSRKLLDQASRMAVMLGLEIESGKEVLDFETAVGRAVQRAVFMAATSMSRGFVDNKENATVVAHLVWEAILACSREPDQPQHSQGQAQMRFCLQKLEKGEVPELVPPWPERLPRILHHTIRSSPNASVFLSQRMALSLHLADWMSLRFHHE
jgi:hypothetical protein